MARRIRKPLLSLKRPQKIALIAGPLVLAPIIVAGIIIENRTASTTSSVSPSAAAPATASVSSPTPEATNSEQPDSPSELTFGQTAHFTSTAGTANIPLDFTVSAPTPFTPSNDAIYFDATSSVVREGTRQATNVYFTVTITNNSTSQSYDPGFVFSHVHSTGDDEQISSVSDADIDGFSSLNGTEIAPGKSVTLKDGYSVKSADHIQYELDIDGLAGKSFYFTN